MGQPFIPLDIPKRPIPKAVLLAIDLDRKPGAVAVEIEHEWTHRMLAAEPEAKRVPAQLDTQTHLRRRHASPQGAGSRNRRIRRFHRPGHMFSKCSSQVTGTFGARTAVR